MKPALALSLTLILVFLTVAPVFAGPPDVQTISDVVDYPYWDHTICPDIAIWDHELYTLRITSYFDDQDNLARVLIHGYGYDNYYNPENPGVVLSGRHFVVNLDVDLQTGEWVNGRGAPFHITVPGYGTVMMRAGRWEVYPDPKIAGKDSETDPKDLAQFCSLLAGN